MYECVLGVGRKKGRTSQLDVYFYSFVTLGWFIAGISGQVGLGWWRG